MRTSVHFLDNPVENGVCEEIRKLQHVNCLPRVGDPLKIKVFKVELVYKC